jgi:hypothetical protein
MKRKKDGKFIELPESAKPKHPVTKRNERNAWTKEEMKELKQLIKENTPTRVISVKMGRSEYAIRAKVKSEGLSLMPINRSPYNRRKSSGRSSEARA